ncbi:MarR family winged helix-turn-helix transcriptional regulator [Rhizobium sp. WYJ-E13]|uniref:MarR family winged helix-turn-helix transcriptional regulator n=1 Tax=unclassified Rhizobium TaxID=2613769 RepID=UPI001C1EF076|nr:hypothetical protein [Rhizobium sp. WYJ-E13]QWW67110.1 hypothetical protein KQ933_16030 [Rhizobium sp. WYJ-E13]
MVAWLTSSTHLQPQSVTHIIAALPRDTLIVRTRSGTDHRQIELSITAHGRKMLPEDIRARRAWLEKVMDGHLTPEERKTLMDASEIMLKFAYAPFSGRDANRRRTGPFYLLQLPTSGYLRRIAIRNQR